MSYRVSDGWGFNTESKGTKGTKGTKGNQIKGSGELSTFQTNAKKLTHLKLSFGESPEFTQ